MKSYFNQHIFNKHHFLISCYIRTILSLKSEHDKIYILFKKSRSDEYFKNMNKKILDIQSTLELIHHEFKLYTSLTNRDFLYDMNVPTLRELINLHKKNAQSPGQINRNT